LRSIVAAVVMFLAGLGCGFPEAPQHPTWADVQPILAGECSHCHGSTADHPGDARTGGGFRLDFYDMRMDVCAGATHVLGEGKPLAFAYADEIWAAITAPADRPDERPRMPPPPAPTLADWQWQTIERWIADGAPKGDLPYPNLPARFRLYQDSGPADRTLDITAAIEDPDGDPVVGVLQLGDFTLKMDRGGAFSATLDTSSWPAGEHAVTAVLCDGWSAASYAVGTLVVKHAP
jgi:hypothetical protein